MEVTFIKTGPNRWDAFDPLTGEWAGKKKLGAVISADFRELRNPAFHRKGMALLQLAYSYFEPGELSNKHGKVEKNFDQFRKDLTILAGFYNQYFRVDGSVRIEAKSLSFSAMDQEEFERVYQALLTVIIEKIMPELTGAEVDKMAEQFWSYA